MAYGFQAFNGGNEVLYSRPARYLLQTVQINPSVASHVTTYTLNLSSALPVGTGVDIAKADDSNLATVDHVFINNNVSSSDTLFITGVSLNAGRTAVVITTEMGTVPDSIAWTQNDCKFYIYTNRGSL